MLPPLFYVLAEDILDGYATLDRAESHHARKVLRLKKGSPVLVVDGNATAYKGEIFKITARSDVSVKIHNEIRNFGEASLALTLAAGLSTNYKFDSVVQKGTELGVSRFVPLITEKSKIKLDEPSKAQRKVKRYEKVAISAMKQSRRSLCPIVSTPMKFKDYIKTVDDSSLNIIFHPNQKQQQSNKSLQNLKIDRSIKRIHLLVGPESGFSNEEIELAEANNFIRLSLGKRVLRTETAGPVAVALIMNLLGELS